MYDPKIHVTTLVHAAYESLLRFHASVHRIIFIKMFLFQLAPKRKRCKYSECDLLNAIADIKSGKSFRAASQEYHIPVMTLNDKVKGKTPLQKYVPGPGTFLTPEQEEFKLVEYLLHMSKIRYGVFRKDIPDLVKNILDKAVEEENYVLPSGAKFIDNKPSRTWVYRFLNRHPEISARTPENLGFHRSYISEKLIREWFSNLKSFMDSEHGIKVEEFFTEKNAERIYNLDESGFPLQGTNGKLKIIAKRGTKNPFTLNSDTKQQITVLACVSAGGTYSKPLVIYPGLNTPRYNFAGVNEEDYDVGFTPNG